MNLSRSPLTILRILREQVDFPGERYTAAADSKAGGDDGDAGFTLLEFLDANFDRAGGNIYVVGRPNFPEPPMDAAYDFVPLGLARRAVRRRDPLPTALWACHSKKAWAAVAAEFRATTAAVEAIDSIDDGGAGGAGDGFWGRPGVLFGRSRKRVAADHSAKASDENNQDGSLSLPPRDKYGPRWWESTLRIIVYEAASDAAAYGLERALAVPDEERGAMEQEMMATAALYLEAVLRSYDVTRAPGVPESSNQELSSLRTKLFL